MKLVFNYKIFLHLIFIFLRIREISQLFLNIYSVLFLFYLYFNYEYFLSYFIYNFICLVFNEDEVILFQLCFLDLLQFFILKLFFSLFIFIICLVFICILQMNWRNPYIYINSVFVIVQVLFFKELLTQLLFEYYNVSLLSFGFTFSSFLDLSSLIENIKLVCFTLFILLFWECFFLWFCFNLSYIWNKIVFFFRLILFLFYIYYLPPFNFIYLIIYFIIYIYVSQIFILTINWLQYPIPEKKN